MTTTNKLEILKLLKEKVSGSMTEKEKRELLEMAKKFEQRFNEKFDIDSYVKIFMSYCARQTKIQAYTATIERKNHIWFPEEKQLLLLYAKELPREVPIAKGVSELEGLLGIDGEKLTKAYYRFAKERFEPKEENVLIKKSNEDQAVLGYAVTIEKSIHTKNQKEIWLVGFKDKIPKDVFADIKLIMQSNQGTYYTKYAPIETLRSKFVFFEEPAFFDAKPVVNKLENTLLKKEKEKEKEKNHEDEILANRLILAEQKMQEILKRVKKKAV